MAARSPASEAWTIGISAPRGRTPKEIPQTAKVRVGLPVPIARPRAAAITPLPARSRPARTDLARPAWCATSHASSEAVVALVRMPAQRFRSRSPLAAQRAIRITSSLLRTTSNPMPTMSPKTTDHGGGSTCANTPSVYNSSNRPSTPALAARSRISRPRTEKPK